MSKLFEFGRFGKVHVGWHFAPDNKSLFILDQSERGEWSFQWKAVEVAITPPSAVRGERVWGIV